MKNWNKGPFGELGQVHRLFGGTLKPPRSPLISLNYWVWFSNFRRYAWDRQFTRWKTEISTWSFFHTPNSLKYIVTFGEQLISVIRSIALEITDLLWNIEIFVSKHLSRLTWLIKEVCRLADWCKDSSCSYFVKFLFNVFNTFHVVLQEWLDPK